LPWRGTSDPYAVWVSEIMLQQTQVATVTRYYSRFLRRFPTATSLAQANEQEVLRYWEGLGYYRRARQMHQAAQVIASQYGGKFPTDAETLRSLPGIGRYTAGAILSIAMDARQAILEANTVRLYSRLIAYDGEVATGAGQRLLWRTAESLLSRRGCGEFNQALMELGSRVCTPRVPDCEHCPAMRLCPTFAGGLTESIPRPAKRPQTRATCEAAVVVYRRGRVLLRQCGQGERWAGLWDFPRFPIVPTGKEPMMRQLADGVEHLTGVVSKPGEHLVTIRHGVTRYRITLLCHRAQYVSGQTGTRGADPVRWLPPAHLRQYPLNATGRRLGKLVEKLGR
jgi:A/G-specific adenine glycosylase